MELTLGLTDFNKHLFGKRVNRNMAVARSNNRLHMLLDSAAEFFATKGYPATTIRDIAGAIGMLPGSIYYHYPNKEALLVAVYEQGVRQLTECVKEAVEGRSDPWERLEAMLAAHIELINEPSAYARVIIRILPGDIPTADAQLIALRREYEAKCWSAPRRSTP